MLTFLGHQLGINWISTDSSTGATMGIFRRDPGVTDAEFRRELRKVKEDIEELQTKLQKLRGVVYAAKRYAAAEEEEEPTPRQMTRDELKRSLVTSGRFVPGKPAKHD